MKKKVVVVLGVVFWRFYCQFSQPAETSFPWYSAGGRKRDPFSSRPRPPRSIAGKRGLCSSVNKELTCSLVENDEESMLFNVEHCHRVQRERTKTRAKNNKETCRASQPLHFITMPRIKMITRRPNFL